ncbi:MAG TPA: gliding motility lipoprotein GldK [Salinimicrobium sp.]|nr:gliding motility lipoprotein GldK [Salinimicrobium sp.]
MKKVFSLIAILALLYSCGRGDRGQLVGAKGKRWHPEKPFGMTLIPGGSFIMGKAGEDIAARKDAPPKTVTVRSFYMDETEITNSEYRQFVEWVRDSIIRTRLAILADELGETPGSGGIGEFAFMDADPANLTPYQQYMLDNYGGGQSGYEGRQLNHDIDLIWETDEYPDEFYTEVMDTMYLPIEESYNGQRTIDVRKLVFQYTWMDIQAAARAKGNVKRSDFVVREAVEIYPDTTVWIKDFNYSYNEPMHNDYFWHEAYGDYPVVGVTWKQAKAFTAWRTLYHNAYRKSKGDHFVNSYRLPTEAEWEYAARGGLESADYPWGGPYAKNDRGCFLANFKPLRGDYAADQALYTVEAESYAPNDYNLYNMSGNVSEWVDSSYDPGSYEYMSSMNPNVNDRTNQRKVVRGGSWKDVSYFLQLGTRDYEYADSARSYIGFRTVQDYLGTDVVLNQPPQ